MKVRRSFMATDENGDEVFVSKGDTISEISDAGPVLNSEAEKGEAFYAPDRDRWVAVEGWNVTVRLAPSHNHWTELVTVDAIKLLKALEG